MNENRMAIGCGALIGFVVGWGISILLAYIFSIDPDHEYGWIAGIFQGTWWIASWIISLFKDNWYIIAPLHTTGYIIWWWIMAILSVIVMITTFKNLIRMYLAN